MGTKHPGRRGRACATGVSLALALACGPREPGADTTTSASESSTDATDTTDGADNLPPSAPALLSPQDGAIDVPLQLELCWTAAEDPEGDALRYRVWIDDVELSDGVTGDDGPGFEATCTGTLDLVGERTYTWRVQAFERDDPGSSSPESAIWSFTTVAEDGHMVLLFDDFSDDNGWQTDGDAATGAWVRGSPQVVWDVDSALAQPDGCHAGTGCFYTGPNPGGTLGEADVDGGSVVLTSPAFDPSGAVSISVSLARFFYRSNLVPTGISLELALLVPDPEAPDGVTVHVLEKLDGGIQAEPDNLWTPVAFAGCGIELRPDTRLRITASDLVEPEAVVVEAAIDEVLIEGYTDADICVQGLGALCDPDDPEPACGPELLCCAQGPVFDGVYRCEYGVASLGDPPPAAPGDPLTGPLGCDAPDLTVLDDNLLIYTQPLFVPQDACSLYEGCVGGTGWRDVLRFDTKTANVGSRDLILGVPANHPDLFHYSPCHQHHHFDDYAAYTLLDGEQVIAAGHKQAFCMVDWESFAWPELGEEDQVYNCVNQGLSLGWSDTYGASLDCQWIDVTGVLPGEYTLRMEVNLPTAGKAHATLVERRYDNNVLEIPVVIN